MYKTEKAIKVSNTHCVKSRFYAKKLQLLSVQITFYFYPKRLVKCKQIADKRKQTAEIGTQTADKP